MFSELLSKKTVILSWESLLHCLLTSQVTEPDPHGPQFLLNLDFPEFPSAFSYKPINAVNYWEAKDKTLTATVTFQVAATSKLRFPEAGSLIYR